MNEKLLLITLLALIVIAFLTIVIGRITKNNTIVKSFSAKESFIMNKIKNLFYGNAVLDRESINKELEIENIQDLNQIFEKNRDELILVKAYHRAIYNRYALSNLQIYTLNPSLYGLILKKNEKLYGKWSTFLTVCKYSFFN